jgi:hypothetical protein
MFTTPEFGPRTVAVGRRKEEEEVSRIEEIGKNWEWGLIK